MTPQGILLVDDDDHIRSISALALSKVGGFDVETAIDGDDALAKLAESCPDVMLLDAMMPGTNGRDVLLRLAEDSTYEQLCVIMLTAKAQPDEVRAYEALGAAGVIAKPFDPMTLATDVRKIWEQHALRQR